jgi:hypothetical protein
MVTEELFTRLHSSKVSYYFRGGVLLISIDSCNSFIDIIAQMNAVIRGFEGFFFDGRNLKPNMDCIADFDTSNEDNLEISRKILASQNPQKVNFIEFIVE